MLNGKDHLNVQTACVIHRVTTPSWVIRERYMVNDELVLTVGGHGRVVLDDRPHMLVPGDLLFLHPPIKNAFSLINGDQLDIYCVHFTTPGEGDTLTRSLPTLTHFPTYTRIEDRFKELYDSTHRHDRLAPWRTNLYLEELIFEIFSLSESRTEPIKTLRIRKILGYVEENLLRDIPLSELSDHFGLQKTSLTALFRETTGSTPGEYIRRMRLDKARKLLLETDLPVNDVAEACGFQDPFYFSRCFKQHFLVPPSRYRTMYH